MIKKKIILALMVITTLYACGPSQSTTDTLLTTPTTTDQLTDGYWELVRQQGTPAIRTPMQGDRKIGFAFQADGGKINGFAGCNSFFGTYSFDGSEISFSQLGSTKMACVQNVIDEQAFLQMFDQVQKLSIENEMLSLLDASNNVLAVFQRTANDGMPTNEEVAE